MAWTIEFQADAVRQLSKLDRQWQRRITAYLQDEIAPLDDPKLHGHALVGPLQGLWRYRVADYRILCQLQQESLVVLVVEVVHRAKAYR
ncbi:addiction module toxin, RelE/StbE family [Terriglobus roseus DSM 18391]|uniref:Addiction module toxin, RelE/StbE family n=1 Tax=Terriglobus roseus (strain DSM 18391 / NRRL B-41598 / KBS 63) TaxID=926566 RepID=I3ZM67_TERRK|nr:type II toxin-antitoxin system RelE/ParE family toxin [Terriglobus roseus]AFL90335.1 addiction module toxin, RelE/StbE family [Terriglobus roseus DSM 18391]